MKIYYLWSDVLKDYFSSDEELYKQSKQFIKWNARKYGGRGNYNYFKKHCNQIQIIELLKDIPELLEYFI